MLFYIFEVATHLAYIFGGEYVSGVTEYGVCVEFRVVVSDVGALVAEFIQVSNKHNVLEMTQRLEH